MNRPGVRGQYFAKSTYDDAALVSFIDAKPSLPAPILPNLASHVRCYWKAWELAFQNTRTPDPRAGFVSNFVDAAYSENVFLYDTCFISMFCNLAHPYVPGIRSLDNFYAKQHANGEICREINGDTGEDVAEWVNDGQPLHSRLHRQELARIHADELGPNAPTGRYTPDLGHNGEPPQLTLDGLNHPIAAWAELESYRQTGDVARLGMVLPVLARFYEALRRTLLDRRWGLYVTDWASMDNSPRNRYLGVGVDISCEMLLFARNLGELARLSGQDDLVEDLDLATDIRALRDAINSRMWDPGTGFYYDVTTDGHRAPVKTIAAYWALLAGAADSDQARRMISWLRDPKTFARPHRVPSLSADDPHYLRGGGYWRGGVWAPTNTVVIRALEAYGEHDLAREIALNHLDNVVRVYEATGTIWENYAPDAVAPGDRSARDFVGWSGIGPILYLLEYVVGLKGDAERDRLIWTIQPDRGEIGCERYWFAGRTIDLRSTPRADSLLIEISSSDPVTVSIRVGGERRDVVAGAHEEVVLPIRAWSS